MRAPTLLLVGALAYAPHPALAAEQVIDPDQRELDQLFERPQVALREVPRGFRVIALSNLAEYYASRLKQGSLEARLVRLRLGAIVHLALSSLVSPYPRVGTLPANLGHHGLYLSHLNIILGAHEAATRSGKYFDLNRLITRHLVGLSDNRWAHGTFYPGRPQRWPADQSALLFSLWLFDRNYDTALATNPISRWLEYISDAAISGYNQLPVSEITATTPTSNIPRGCALSYSVRYMAAFAPAEASALWRRYVDSFEVSALTITGLREWPRGYSGPTDIDSGPIIMGVGAAATGFGIGAARAVGDHERHRRLLRTMRLVYSLAPQSLQDIGSSLLARSIALQGTYLERWYERAPAR